MKLINLALISMITLTLAADVIHYHYHGQEGPQRKLKNQKHNAFWNRCKKHSDCPAHQFCKKNLGGFGW